MKNTRIAATLLTALLLMTIAASALAYTDPTTKTLEDTFTYEGKGIRITIDQWCWYFQYKRQSDSHNARFFVANVYVDDPSQLRSAFAYEEYTKNRVETTSTIAGRHDAVIAINGDYYNFKDDHSLVIRNGELYRDKDSTRDILLIYDNGWFGAIRKGDYQKGSGEQYLADGVVQSLIFGPLLVLDGEMVELPAKYIINTKESIREPRAAIGQVDPNHYVLLVADGRRKNWSERGLSLQDMQRIFVEQGCHIAYNLDGGGSATMVLNGERVNKTSGSREREVSDILYFTELE